MVRNVDVQPGKLQYGDPEFISPEQRLSLKPIAASGRMPAGPPAAPDFFSRARMKLDRRGRAVELAFEGADRKRLLDWSMSSKPKFEAMDDGFDKPSAAARKTEGMSIAGRRPDFLPFEPFPFASTESDRLKDALDEMLKNGVVTFDSRNPSMTSYPWSTCGKMFRQRATDRQMHPWGSGFMFGGRVVMTARHLFPEDITTALGTGTRYFFAPGYSPRFEANGGAFPFGISEVTGVRGKRYHRTGLWGDPKPWDYAICHLNDRLGDRSGTMGVACFGKSESYRKTKDRYPRPRYYDSAGYPDFNGGWPVQETWAKIRDVDGGPYERELETVDFAGPGWSGGPLFGYLDEFGGTYVVGVCSGREVADSFLPPYVQCVWAGGKRMVELADWAVANWWD